MDDTQQPRCENEETLALVEHALLNLWGVANDLARIRPPRDRYRVTIFGSARVVRGQPLYEEVVNLARRLSAAGCDIVSGGGPGLMQAANEGEQAGDPRGETQSLGVRIDLPFEQGVNPFVETVYTHRTFFSRLHQFIRLSNSFVVFRGGIGTTLETLMVWQLLQVRHLHGVPLVLVGSMWEDLVEWARSHMVGDGLPTASKEDVGIPTCVANVEEAAEVIEAHRRETMGTGHGPCP